MGVYLGGRRLDKILTIIGVFAVLQVLSCVCTYFCMLYTWKGAIKFEACLKKDFIRALNTTADRSYRYGKSKMLSLSINDAADSGKGDFPAECQLSQWGVSASDSRPEF